MATCFYTRELQSRSREFDKIVEQKRSTLDERSRQWLDDWQAFNLALGALRDKERGLIRYAHHCGWMQHCTRESSSNAEDS